MKFIEIATRVWDDDAETEVPTTMLLALDQVGSVIVKKHKITIEGRNVEVAEPYITLSSDDNVYVTNYSYEELKRILLSNANVVKTGVGR